MDVRNVDSRLQHLGYGPQLPPGPEWGGAVRNQPPTPTDAPAKGQPTPNPELVAPHAAPAERQIILSQQSISDALRELKLPETPQYVMIAQSLAQMDQPVSSQNMTMVREALKGLATANADDIAAAVVLLMHDLPVTPAGIAAVRQLMNGPALPEQLARLGQQLTHLLGQLDQTGQQLATLGQPGLLPGQVPGQIPGQIPNPPAPGTVPGQPLNIVPAAAQAAASAQAAAATAEPVGDTVGEFTAAEGDDSQGSGDSQGPEGSSKGGPAGGAGGTAGLTGTGNRRENAAISRALGGAIGRMTSDQTEGVGQLPSSEQPPAADMPAANAGKGEHMEQQGGSPRGGQSSRQPQPPGDADTKNVSLEQVAAKSANTQPKLNIGSQRPAQPDAPLPPGLTAPGTPSQGTPARATGQASSSLPPGQTVAPSGNTSQSDTRSAGQPLSVPQTRINVGATGDTAPPQTTRTAVAGGSAPSLPTGDAPVAAKLAPAVQLLRSAELATTVREPAYLPQQVSALKTVFRELPGALLHVAKELREFAADPRPVADIPLPELERLLAKAVGHKPGASLDAQDESLLRHLFEDLRKAIVTTSGSLHETLGNLHAREQLTQSTNVMCLPLALPGPPPRPVELLVEADPDDEHRRRQGSAPTQMKLSIDTHHLGRVGIDLVSWQEKLSIKLQVGNPKIQHLVAAKLEELDKALARSGFVAPDLSVAIAPAEQRASMLLPERKYMRSLRRIEGII
jgi:hypothetical protein